MFKPITILLMVAVGFIISCNGNGVSGRQQITVSISGMHCAACVVSVRKNLQKIEGIEKIRMLPARGEAIVFADSAKVDSSDILNAVARAGFSARFP